MLQVISSFLDLFPLLYRLAVVLKFSFDTNSCRTFFLIMEVPDNLSEGADQMLWYR